MNLTLAGTSSIQTLLKVNTSESSSVSGRVFQHKHASSSQEDSGKVFSFRDAHVREYLSSLSSDDSSSSCRSSDDGPKYLTGGSAEEAPPAITFPPKRKMVAGPEEVVPLFEDISSHGSVEVINHVPGNVCVEAGETVTTDKNEVSVCILYESQQSNPVVSPLKEDPKHLQCDSDCIVVSVLGSHCSDRLEGPLTRSRKRQINDSASSSFVRNGNCNGDSGEDGKTVKRRKYEMKQRHGHRHRRGGKRVKRISTVVIE